MSASFSFLRRSRSRVLVSAFGLILVVLVTASCSQTTADTVPDKLAGYLESSTVTVSPEIRGRLVEVLADEGDTVTEGQVLARLDDSHLRLEMAQAGAAVTRAEAELALLKASVRPVDVSRAEANVTYAQAALDAAESALRDANTLKDTPQQSDLDIAQAEAEVTETSARASAARHAAQAADTTVQMYGTILKDLEKGFDVDIPGVGSRHFDAPKDKLDYVSEQWNLASQDAWSAWQASAAADAAANEAKVALQDRKRERAAPLSAEDRVVAATNARDQAKAGLDEARAALEAVKAGPSAEKIAAAEAAVTQARAAQDAVAKRLAKTTLVAPKAGTITARYRSQGEVIGPNQRLMTISDPNALEIMIYAPTALLPKLQPGTELPLSVDNAPGQQFKAEVMALNEEPEFSLRQAQNVAERADAVYGVRLRLSSPDPLLRPGMPADVVVSR